jgi:large subunit ribosomal protein L9
MRVVLREDVDHLGHKGDLLEVADGYARNFLVPRGLAMKATKGIVAQADAMRRSRAARDARDQSSAAELAARLDAATIRLRVRAGEGGKLFGSVTSTDVAEAVQAQTGIDVDRRVIDLPEPIKELGAATVSVRLHPEVVATLHLEVAGE